jgi:hypothetical protein
VKSFVFNKSVGSLVINLTSFLHFHTVFRPLRAALVSPSRHGNNSPPQRTGR